MCLTRCRPRAVLLALMGASVVLALPQAARAQGMGGLNGQLLGNIQGVAGLLADAVEQGAPRNEINQIDDALRDLVKALRFGDKHKHRRHHKHHRGPFGAGLGQFANAANGAAGNNNQANNPGAGNNPANPGANNTPAAGQGGNSGSPPHRRGRGAFGAGMSQAGTGPDRGLADRWDRDDRRHDRDRRHHRGAFGDGFRLARHAGDHDGRKGSTGPTSTGTQTGGRLGGKGAFSVGVNVTVNCCCTDAGKSQANTGNTLAANTGGTGKGSKAGVAGQGVGTKGTNRPGGTAVTANKANNPATGTAAGAKGTAKAGPSSAVGGPKSSTAVAQHIRASAKGQSASRGGAKGGAGVLAAANLKGGKGTTATANKSGVRTAAAGKLGTGKGRTSTGMHTARVGHKTGLGKSGSAAGQRGGRQGGTMLAQTGHRGMSAGGHIGGRLGGAHAGASAHRGTARMASAPRGGRLAGGSVGARGNHSSGARRR